MKVEKRICDLCRCETKGKFAKLSAPQKWAKGEYEEEAPAPVTSEDDVRRVWFSFVEMGSAKSSGIELDICRHCFKSLFGTAAWLRDLMQQEKA